MKKQKKEDWPESNPFVEGFLDWMESPDGDLSMEIMDTVSEMLEKADLDAKKQKLIWEDGERLSIDESVQRIHAANPEFPVDRIETHVISWIEMDFAPESYTEQQLDELDRLTESWIDDHERRHRRR
jgi:hypothetical protein